MVVYEMGINPYGLSNDDHKLMEKFCEEQGLSYRWKGSKLMATGFSSYEKSEEFAENISAYLKLNHDKKKEDSL